MIYTTLNELHLFGPCKTMWTRLITHLGKTKTDDDPLPLVTVLDHVGLADTIWCLRVCPDVAVTFARWCATEAAATKDTTDAYWAAAAEAFWAAYRVALAAKSADETDADWAFWADWAANAANAANGPPDRQIAKLRELLS